MDPNEWERRSAAFVDELRSRQRELRWSDRRMARELGVSHTLWIKTRTGQTTIGIAVLQGVGDRFPDYGAEILTLFQQRQRARVPIGTPSGPLTAGAPVEAAG